MIRFITHTDLYEKVIIPMAGARTMLWIGTADIKDMQVKLAGEGSFVGIPFFEEQREKTKDQRKMTKDWEWDTITTLHQL